MNNRKLLFTLALLLLAPPLFAQEPPPPASVNGNAGSPPQPQPKNEDVAFGSTSDSVSASFEGMVVQVEPLEVKSVSGQVRQFLPGGKKLSMVQPRRGDLVRLSYEPGPNGNILHETRVIGKTIAGTIKEIAADMSWLIVRTQQPDKPENEVNVPLQASAQFQPLVAAMRPGDGINATYVRDGGTDAVDGINHVKSLEWQSKPVTREARWLSLTGAVVLLWTIAYVFTKGHPADLYLGRDNRYSSSKFQTVLWFWLVISAYIAIVSHRILAAGWSYVGGVDIPPHLLILSGISVLTFTAAKAITAGKVERAASEGKTDVKTSADIPQATDLICDDSRRTDLGDFQMVVITILAVIIYAISAVEFMEQIEFRRVVTMPDVDATLLSIFGLGQAAYLGKKAAGER
ncbi:hypothetical protein [Nitrosovibrio sp. Nv6]|uniref:hypothetical protein n=1 Tax=Nitrosovibrio sp. Nv6 TaxID=1855340 RepID=UPI0008B8014C|nr:hypothetical protein [Nitrosovibrio sp. Nv6]SEO59616.1 hypothetical protein SAMN05216316_0576 [Nitrosovibrio sp. Nv6]